MFPLTITSVNKVFFRGMVDSVNCPGSDGELTVLTHHAPLITTLKSGFVKVKKENLEEENFEIKKGILEVNKNEVVILVP